MERIKILAVKWGIAAAMTAAVSAMACGCFAGRGEQDPGIGTESLSGIDGGQAVTASRQPAASGQGGAPEYVDDFYNAVNHVTLSGWEIPGDQPEISWFSKVREENYNKVNDIIQQASSGTGKEDGRAEGGEEDSRAEGDRAEEGRAEDVREEYGRTPVPSGDGENRDRENIRALNLTGLDREAREKGGYGRQAGEFLDEAENAGTVEELLSACLRFQRDYGIYSLTGLIYTGDSNDSSVKSLYLMKPDTGLKREVWFSKEEANIKRVEEYKRYLTRLHESNGLGTREAEGIVERVTAMMRDLASSSLKIEETYDAEKTNNVYTARDAAAVYGGALPMDLLSGIYGVREDERTIVAEPEVCRKLGTYLTDDNLPLLKEYVKTCLYADLSMITDMESLNAAQEYQMAVSGTEEKKPFGRTVSETVQQELGFQCGRLFCRKYFDDAARQDVTDIIRKVIDVYDKRLAHMEWMTETTRSEARKKLASIMVKVGYPGQWPQDRYGLKLAAPEDGGLYVDNILTIKKADQDYMFRTKDDPVDRTEWAMTPQTVNAYYNPGSNEIVFPAGILQPPFYDPEGLPVTNLGRIGAVIGHDITHAFDTSGSQYDEQGNLRDWWTAEDKQRFKELAARVEAYYDSMEVNGTKVNGTLSVTENIADLGGVSCVTEIAKNEGYDLRELYKAYAALWAGKYRDEYLAYIMTNDVHSPGIIRVNAVLSATSDFYAAFHVKEGDGMYQEVENRAGIW